MSTPGPILEAHGLVKRYGHVVALDGADLELYPGDSRIIGDNGAGKSTLIKALSGALQPDEGEISLDGERVHFRSPATLDEPGSRPSIRTSPSPPRSTSRPTSSSVGSCADGARTAASYACSTRAPCGARPPDTSRSSRLASARWPSRSRTSPRAASGRRRRPGRHLQRGVIMDEPTAALGVKETRQVLDLIQRVRERGLPVILISHDMPHVFELADRIQIMRLGKRVAVVTPQTTRCRRPWRS